MKARNLRAVAVLIAAAALLCRNIEAAPVISAQRGVLIDGATGRVIWERDSNTPALIASTTKIMTALIVAEECDLQAEVIIPNSAAGIEGSSIYLKEGETLSVEALLYGMMLHSGNDAATALALYCGGSLDGFVEKMNSKAKALSLSNTSFANPHGLDSESNFASAYDLAKLASSAMDNTFFRQIVSTKSITFGDRTFTNHNKLLWQYEGCVGIKTGYTRAAGRILVSAAERNGRRLIAVTINAPNDWQDHSRLFDYGFTAYNDQTLLDSRKFFATVPVVGGADERGCAILHSDIHYPLSANERVEYRLCLPEFVYAPLLAGDRAGELELWIDGVKMLAVPLYWKHSVLEGA